MKFDHSHPDVVAMPAVLRALLEAELTAGNTVSEVGHSFPAPPAGAYFKLDQPLRSRSQKSGDGIDYYDRNSSSYSGEITDSKRFYFLLEPPRPPPPEPDMGAIRAALSTGFKVPASTEPPRKTADEPETPVRRFQRSLTIDYEKWHDGIGYDLGALAAMSDAEKTSTEARLLRSGLRDWRDVEALAFLDTPKARVALKAAMATGGPEIRNAVSRHSPDLIPSSEKAASLVKTLESAVFYGGLTQALDQVAEFHPPVVIEALFQGALNRAGDVAVHFAAMLCYIFKQAPEPFDMAQRPFFLRFNTEDRAERITVFRELCSKVQIDPARFLFPAEYVVRVDHRGEMLTYVEAGRTATVICTFTRVPCILTRTLSSWFYLADKRTVPMSAAEKEVVIARIAGYSREHLGMSNLTFET